MLFVFVRPAVSPALRLVRDWRFPKPYEIKNNAVNGSYTDVILNYFDMKGI